MDVCECRGDDTTGFQSPAQDYVEDVVDLTTLPDLRRPVQALRGRRKPRREGATIQWRRFEGLYAGTDRLAASEL